VRQELGYREIGDEGVFSGIGLVGLRPAHRDIVAEKARSHWFWGGVLRGSYPEMWGEDESQADATGSLPVSPWITPFQNYGSEVIQGDRALSVNFSPSQLT